MHTVPPRVVAAPVTRHTMRLLFAALALTAVPSLGATQPTTVEEVHELVFQAPGVGDMPYALSVPAGYDAAVPRPLVLALHPGSGGTPYYGGAFMRQVVQPALRSWEAIIVAPDSPTRSWTSATSERAVLALIDAILEEYAIDRDRILVTGFSLGGRGTWFMATHHPELFDGAIAIAGSPGRDRLEDLGSMPVHIIHSVDDDVMPIEPARAAAEALEARQQRVRFTELEGIGHFTMSGYVGALAEAGAWMLEQWRQDTRGLR